MKWTTIVASLQKWSEEDLLSEFSKQISNLKALKLKDEYSSSRCKKQSEFSGS